MATTSTNERPGPQSIRRLLFKWTIAPLTGLLLLTAFLGYPIALRPATSVFDWALMDTVHAIARLTALTGGYQALIESRALDTILRSDEVDRIYYSVHSADGRLLAGDPELIPPPRRPAADGEFFYDSMLNGTPVRVAAIVIPRSGGTLMLQAAETTVKRTQLTRQILTGVILVEILVITMAAVLVWLGIGKSLRPLERLRAEIEGRSHRDLRPLPERDAPLEARPLVTALNKLLERLSAVLGAQRDFVENAAHQMRTPVAGMRMQIEYALSQDDPAEWRHALNMLSPASARAVHLVNQLLALARADAGASFNVTMEVIDARLPVEEVIGNLMPQAIAKNIDVGLELEPSPVCANPFLLSELVSNLVDNAVTYSAIGGRVTVRTRQSGGATAIEVEDDGPGIPEREREDVFRRFHRMEGAPGRGCGLGLAIVRKIAQIHRADVELRDPPGGTGTLIVVTFPAASLSPVTAA